MSTAKILDAFPNAKGAVVVMSGGMDSAIAARLCVEKLGGENVHAISFFYGQKQSIELELAQVTSKKLGIARHQLVDISYLGDMVRGVCANIVGGLVMPTITDVLGDPAPPTEVPFRNSILLTNACSYAQVNGLDLVVTGLQAQDEYSYWDTTPHFVSAMNSVVSQNRMHKIQIYAPWQGMNKAQEIEFLRDIDGNVDLLASTLTCYNPNGQESCGVCPSCAERIANFMKVGLVDPIQYSINIDWK